MGENVLLTTTVRTDLESVLKTSNNSPLFLLCDEHTQQHCVPVLEETINNYGITVITVPSGEVHKNLDTLSHIWSQLGQAGTRRSLLVNVGGGVVTDMGGFAAATFKRGIPYINVPTTLLAMVDASVGGKTGIDFNGLKNEIGAFHAPQKVLIDARFLQTLDYKNICSGYAEMLKHALLESDELWAETIAFDLEHIDYDHLQALIAQSIDVKQNIVQKDPYEKNLRKALNLGHTFGHAFESLSIEENRPILHGFAVAFGLICELYLSHLKLGFPSYKLRQAIQFIKENYGAFAIDCKQYEHIYSLMKHDKKNTTAAINFTLLSDVGRIEINQEANKEDIFEILDFFANN